MKTAFHLCSPAKLVCKCIYEVNIFNTVITQAFLFSILALEQRSSTAKEDHIGHLNVEIETMSSTTAIKDGDKSEKKKEREEITNTAAIIISNSSIENTLKKQNDLKDRIYDSYEKKIKKLSAIDSRKLVSSKESTAASTVEEMTEMLERNLKKLTTNSNTASFNKRLKSLKQTKLQVSFQSVTAFYKLLLLSCFHT